MKQCKDLGSNRATLVGQWAEVAPGSLKPAKRRTRSHPKSKMRALRGSIAANGIVAPIVIDAEGGIVDGHLRAEIAIELGLPTVPVIRVDHMSEADLKALAIAANRMPADVTWDMDALRIAELLNRTAVEPDGSIDLGSVSRQPHPLKRQQRQKPMEDGKDYKIGRGKPPVHSQFKKGQSGNPKGAQRHKTKRNKRRFGARDFAIRLANEKVPVTVRGQLRQMLVKEAMMRRIFMDFLEATPNVRARPLLQLVQIGAFDFDETHFQSRHDRVQAFLEQLAAEAAAHEKPD